MARLASSDAVVDSASSPMKNLVSDSVLVRLDFSVLAANNALESPDLTSATPEIYHSTDVRCLSSAMLAKYGFNV